MAERFNVRISLLLMLVLAFGSLQLGAFAADSLYSDTLKPAQDANQTLENDPNEPGIAEPLETEPNEPAPQHTDPNEASPAPAEPNQSDPNIPEIGNMEPNSPDPNRTPPAGKDPNNTDPNSTIETEPNDPNMSPAAIFHNKCASILKDHVSPSGKVNYGTLARKKPNLSALLDDFDKLDPNIYETWPKEDKIAFWINAYNIKMLDIVTPNYPIKPISRFHSVIWGAKSIRHIEGIWTKHKFLVMDEEFTLLEIDKRFFRKEFADPRILFALNRASLSGPPLRNEPYFGYKLNQQLDDQAKKFLSNPLAFKIDKDKGRVYLSALFQKTEYARTFLPKYGIDRKFKSKTPETRAVLNFITNYVQEDVKTYLELGNYTVQFMGYDWTINDGP